MFGSNTGSAFGAANNSSTTGGLFGANKPAASSGFSFGSSNNNNTANTSSGNLFGNSNTNNNSQGSGGLFGNNSNNQQQQQQQQSGGLFGAKPAAPSAGLFGNNNSSSSTGTPTSGGLFGNNNASTPSGGLFRNSNAANTSSGGIFGNNSASASPAPSGGLFGSKPATQTGGLFGNNTASTPAKPSLFGSSTNTNGASGGLFGANATASPAPNSLFGNSTNTNPSFNPLMNTTPVKQYNFKDLPKSLTDSSTKAKTIQNATSNRKRSLTNTSNPVPANQGRSSLMEKLGSRFSTINTQSIYNSEGLFSPKKDLIRSTDTSETTKDRKVERGHFYKPFASGMMTTRSVRAPRTASTDYLKLSVDRSRSDARRLKIFGDAGGAKKVRILGREEDNVLSIKETAESVELNGVNGTTGLNDVRVTTTETITPQKSTGLNAEEEVAEPLAQTYDDDYWCSPSIEELQQLPLRQLAEIPDFTIGRKGYGVINFGFPVDLTAFWSDLPGNLFGKVVRFAKRGTVEVNPNMHVPLGSGLNVPATITLEKVFPVSKNKSQEKDSKVKDLEYRLFVKRLREMKDMELVTYEPINGSWTFKVKHFSVWGLVDEDDAVVDVDEALEQLKKKPNGSEASSVEPVNANASNGTLKTNDTKRAVQKSINPTEDTFIYKRQKQDNTFEFDSTVFMPGSFIVDNVYTQARQLETLGEEKTASPPQTQNILSEMDSDDDVLDEANVPLGLIQDGDQSLMEEDFGVVERPFEPENVEESDFEILDADPKLAVSDDWDRQLELSSRFDSAFGNSTIKATTIYDAPFSKPLTSGDLDKLLYGDFEAVIKSRRAIQKELRLDGYKFGEFSTFNTVVVESSKTRSHAVAKSLAPLYGSQDRGFIFKRHLAASKITKRSNGFPHVSKNDQLSFKLITDAHSFDANANERTVWELASVLFDNNVSDKLQGVSDLDVINRVLEIQRRDGLISWLKKEVQTEIDSKLESVTDEFEQMFLLLAASNISSAAKRAIQTKNPHLSVLISLLGSNDPTVRHAADMQLQNWKKSAVLHTIPAGLVKIYYLLKGDVLATSTDDLSWKAKLGLLLCYGDLNESLAVLLSSFVDAEAASVPKADLTYFNLLKLYVYKHDSTYSINEIFTFLKTGEVLNVALQWYVYEILVRSTNQMRFGNNAEFGDRLTLLLAEQLEVAGSYQDALFVLAHLSNDDACKSSMIHLITSHYDLLNHPDYVTHLQDVLKIPSDIISEAKALYFRYIGDHEKEAHCLLDAQKFEEAHRQIIQTVAPAAIINNGSKISELERLIARFPERRHIIDWNIGLAVYKNYLKLLSAKSTPEAPLRYLAENIPSMHQTNFKVKVAIKLMSKHVAMKLCELQLKQGTGSLDLHLGKATHLPLGESERSMVDLVERDLKKSAFAH